MTTTLSKLTKWKFATVAVMVLSTSFAQDPQTPPPIPPAPPEAGTAEPNKAVNFRSASPNLNAGNPVAPDEGQGSVGGIDELMDRRDAIEGEIRYSRNKLEGARRRAGVLQSLGKSEEADQLASEIRDLEARIKTAVEQVSEIELQSEKLNSSEGGGVEMLNGEEVVLPGNNLEVWVNEDTAFNGRYVVRRGGYIILPQVGRVMVAGKTIAQAESSVRKALQSTQLRRATVMIERFDGQDIEEPTILLAGEFRSPRPFKIPRGTAPTVVSVLIASGGWTERADLTRVKVMRMAGNQSVVEEINVKKIMEGNPAVGLGGDIALTEGDVLVIPSGALNLVYVTGQVKKAGSYKIGENEKLTVYGAILQSGGLAHFASKSKVHVLRSMPDGTKAKLPVSLDEVIKGKRPDVILQPNDIVVVPEKWFSW